jgi:hypothetical protein
MKKSFTLGEVAEDCKQAEKEINAAIIKLYRKYPTLNFNIVENTISYSLSSPTPVTPVISIEVNFKR